MSFASDLADGVALAKELLEDEGLIGDVTHHVAGAHTGYTVGETTVTRKAMVRDHVETIRTPGGQERQSRHRVTFFEHVAVDPERDRFTVPGGTARAPVLDVRGLQNAESGGRFVTVVMLG